MIPDKLYFRIGEVSRILGVEPFVVRYWQSEFPAVNPKKLGRSHRYFRRKDVEVLLEIKHLLYEKRYTVEGARKVLESKATPTAKRSKAKPPAGSMLPVPVQPALFADSGSANPPALREIRDELRDLLAILSRDPQA